MDNSFNLIDYTLGRKLAKFADRSALHHRVGESATHYSSLNWSYYNMRATEVETALLERLYLWIQRDTGERRQIEDSRNAPMMFMNEIANTEGDRYFLDLDKMQSPNLNASIDENINFGLEMLQTLLHHLVQLLRQMFKDSDHPTIQYSYVILRQVTRLSIL